MMGCVTPDEWRDQIGRHIEQRRKDLRLSVRAAARRAGFSEGQWRQMENGKRTLAAGQFVAVNPRPDTRAAASAALGWTDDSIDRLEDGDEPALAAAAARSPDLDGLANEVAELHAEIDSLWGVVHELASAAGIAVPSTSREPAVLAIAAEGAAGAPPARSGRATAGPHPAAEATTTHRRPRRG